MRPSIPMIVLPLLALCACSGAVSTNARPPSGAAQNNPVVVPNPGRARCDASGLGDMVGRTASTVTVQQAGRQSGARDTRVIGPGQPVTMDFREDRLNIEVDARNRIVRFNCG